MKIKNTNDFRTELFKALRDMYFDGCKSKICTECFYEEKPSNKTKVHHLYDAFILEKTHYDWTTPKCNETIDVEFIITVSEVEVDLWITDSKNGCYCYEDSLRYDDYPNKTVFMMSLAVEIARMVRVNS